MLVMKAVLIRAIIKSNQPLRLIKSLFLISFFLLPIQSFPQGAVLHTREADFLKGMLDELQTTKIGDGEISLVNPSLSLNEWKETTPIPEPLYNHQSLVHNGNLYILGGFGEGSVSVSAVYMAKILESGELDSFIRLAPIPKDLHKHTSFVWDNKLYVVGGSLYYKEKGEEKEHLSKYQQWINDYKILMKNLFLKRILTRFFLKR